MRDFTYSTKPEASARRKKTAAIFAATLLLAGCNASQGGGTGTAAGKGNPASPGKPVEVGLIWNKAKNEWKVKFNNGNEQDPKNAHWNLNRNVVGPTMFEVKIDGGGSSPPTLKADALWVWEGKGKKSSPLQGIHSTQILGPVMTKDGTLIFWDLNQGDQVTLNYQLNFENGVPAVDPIIDNGGHD